MGRLTIVVIVVVSFAAGTLLRDQTINLYTYAVGLVPYRLAVVAQPNAKQPPPSTVGRFVRGY